VTGWVVTGTGAGGCGCVHPAARMQVKNTIAITRMVQVFIALSILPGRFSIVSRIPSKFEEFHQDFEKEKGGKADLRSSKNSIRTSRKRREAKWTFEVRRIPSGLREREGRQSRPSKNPDGFFSCS
jgi:hypothetical protein